MTTLAHASRHDAGIACFHCKHKAQHVSLPHTPLQYSRSHHSTAQHSAVQPSTVQRSISTAQRSMHSIVQHAQRSMHSAACTAQHAQHRSLEAPGACSWHGPCLSGAAGLSQPSAASLTAPHHLYWHAHTAFLHASFIRSFVPHVSSHKFRCIQSQVTPCTRCCFGSQRTEDSRC